MKLIQPRTRKVTGKLLNLGIAASLLLTMMPASIASAADGAAANVNPDCTRTAGASLFLPILQRAGEAGAAAAEALDAVAAVAVPGASHARQLNYQEGKRYVYDWSVNVDTKSSGRSQQGSVEQSGQQKTVLSGVAEVTILDKAADGTVNGQVTIASPFVCSSDGTTPSVLQGTEYDQLAAALQQPLLFTQTAAGKVTTVSVPQGSPPLAINMQKGIVNALQATLQDANAYTAQEEGAQGTYGVAYTVAEKADGIYITKRYDQNSFSKLISAGDETESLQQKNMVEMVINADGVFQSITSAEEIQSSDESSTPQSTGDAGFDGVAAWSLTSSKGALTLRAVNDADAAALAASLTAAYVADDLGAELSEELPNAQGIDLSTVDLASEFAALEADPTNPALVLRIGDLVLADESDAQTVLTQLQVRIEQNSGNSDVVNAYVDVLARVGTPRAQEVMSAIAGSQNAGSAAIGATMTITSQEHALISMVLLEAPTSTSVETIRTLVDNESSSLQDTAVTVLGATADHLDDPAAASAITDQLLRSLDAAGTEEEITLYLDALGNTGDPAALGTLERYIDGNVPVSDTLGVELSALSALRKMPGDAAEGLLLGALNRTNDEVAGNPDLFLQRELAAEILAGREALSDSAVAALEAHSLASLALPSGYYTRSWNRHFGGSTVGVNLPGFLGIATPPSYYPYLYARQAADAHIWSYTRNLIYGDLLARSTGSAFQFRAYMHIGGGLIRREYNVNLPCSYNGGGNLYNGNVTLFNVTISVPIFWAITVNFNIRGSGYFSLNWNYSHNVCLFTSGNFTGRITPTVWARAEASAYLNIVVARGGGTLEADLLKTSVPGTGTVSYGNAQVSFCVNVTANTQALSGRFYVWGDLRVPRFGIPPWKWSRKVSATLWTFGTGSGSYTLYNACF